VKRNKNKKSQQLMETTFLGGDEKKGLRKFVAWDIQTQSKKIKKER